MDTPHAGAMAMDMDMDIGMVMDTVIIAEGVATDTAKGAVMVIDTVGAHSPPEKKGSTQTKQKNRLAPGPVRRV